MSKGPKFLYRNEKSLGPDGQVRDRGGTIVLTDWGRVLGRRMLEPRLQGMSLASIAERAIEEELVPVQHQARFRGPGRAARVEHILKSRFHLDEFEWAEKTFAGRHEALFTSEEWTALQRTFNGVPAPLRADHCAAPLAGLMKCGECGCAITFERKVKKSGREFRYLRCANGKKAHPSLVYVPEEDVFNEFASAIASIAINTNLAEEIGAVLSERARTPLKPPGSVTPRAFRPSSPTSNGAKIYSTTTARAACWMTTGIVDSWRACARCAATQPRKWRQPTPTWTMNGFSRRSAL